MTIEITNKTNVEVPKYLYMHISYFILYTSKDIFY